MNLNVKAIGRLAYRLRSLAAVTHGKFEAFMIRRRENPEAPVLYV
jgi:hypothetical protein